nr:MAG TPA: upper collar protein [Caudoviricetes sp.]
MFLNNYTSKIAEKLLLKETELELQLPQSVNYWIEMLFEKIVRIFEWKGLPFPQREIEMRLITTGFCGFVKDDLLDYMVAYGGMSGHTQYFDVFKDFTYSAPLAKGGTKKINKECVIINNTALRNPMNVFIKRYAILLAHCDVTLVMSLVNLRTKNIIATDDQGTADSYKEMFKKFYKGEFSALIDKGLLGSSEGLNNVALPTSGNIGVMECIDAKNEIMRMFYNDIGVRYTRDKKERMIESEVENDQQLLLFNINDMLRQRENACKKINELFDLNVSVKLAPEFNIIDRKEVGTNDNK